MARQLGDHAEITLISKDAEFTFLPSLPWVILGWRDPTLLQIPLRQPLARRRIDFVHAEVTEIDPAKRQAHTAAAQFPYDSGVPQLPKYSSLEVRDQLRVCFLLS